MIRSILRGMLALVALAALGYNTGVSAATCTVTLLAGADIQTAINSATAGDVICLSAGTYSPASTIDISKSITLQGPQVGVDPRPSAGTTRVPGSTSTEAIIDGTSGGLISIIVITADNVVLDGLQVKSGSGDMIYSATSIPTTGTIVRYNIVNNATGDEGMQIRACTDCFIEYNYVFDIAQDGINLCCDSTGGTIQFNEVTDNDSDNAAIYVYDSINTLIRCNLVYDVTDNDGIKLGAKGGGDSALSGGSILNNTVHHTNQDGITVYMSDTLVEGNDVSYSSSENGAIYVSWAVSDVTVKGNEVHNNTLDTIKPPAGGITIGTAVDAATVSVNNNNITANTDYGLANKAVASLDGKTNWWGAADGPSGAGSGSGDAVSANVDFSSFLVAPEVIPDACTPVPTYTCQGFEPPMNLAYLPPALGGGAIARRVKKNRVFPFKATLVDGDGNVVTDLVAAPKLEVYADSMLSTSVDITDDSFNNGKRTEGTEFFLAGNKWNHNLASRGFGNDMPGTYFGVMVSGDPSEYVISPICQGVFVIEF